MYGFSNHGNTVHCIVFILLSMISTQQLKKLTSDHDSKPAVIHTALKCRIKVTASALL